MIVSQGRVGCKPGPGSTKEVGSGILDLLHWCPTTGLDRAVARRLVLTLVHLGYVSQEERVFFLTPKILVLAGGFLQGMFAEMINPKLIFPKLQRSGRLLLMASHGIFIFIRVYNFTMGGENLRPRMLNLLMNSQENLVQHETSPFKLVRIRRSRALKSLTLTISGLS